MGDEDEDYGSHKKAAGGEETETQKILEARKKKNIEEDDQKLKEMEEERRKQREIEEEELQQLKERQERRKKEREAEMKKMEEMRLAAEQRRMQEEEERKTKEEELRRKKQEDAARKKAAAVNMSFIGTAAIEQGKNFTVNKNDGGGSSLDKFMSLTQVRNEMAFTQDQLEDLKQKTIRERVKPLELDGMGVDDLKRRAEELWQQIIKLETSKYDLDTRFLRQEYDLKEMAERQRQMQKQRWVKAGMDPAEDAKLVKFPPKVQTASKYERQIDRRSWGDKREIYEKGFNNVEEKERITLGDIKLKDESSWIKPKEAYGERRHAGYGDDDGADEEPFEPKFEEPEINIPRRSRDEGSSRRKSVEEKAPSKHEEEEEEEQPRQAAAPAASRYTAVDEDDEEDEEEE